MMELNKVGRPRNVGWARAAALLYGDWGTSKAYVIGIGFALLGYTALPHFLAVAALTAIVGFNYIWICKYFPTGGGVYSSAQKLSQKLAVIGALMLVADYIITASLSCFEAFHYFGFESHEAQRFAALAIFGVGFLNFFGPKHTGGIAIWLAAPTLLVVIVLLIAGLFHLDEIRIEPVQGGFGHNWVAFVGIILALSGVEAIASTTGVMRLDKGSTPEKPSVHRTSKIAITIVLIEVAVATALLGLFALALPKGAMLKPEGLLRYMGELWIGPWFGWIVGVVFGLLLLSAVNTAIGGLIAILYLLAHDGELPRPFTQLNRFGVPWVPLIVATVAPVIVLESASPEHGVHYLASLYAIGVVGAICINLFSCGVNRKLPMKRWERAVMLMTFLILSAVWVTIAITKGSATLFMILVLAAGFLLRYVARKQGVEVSVEAQPGLEMGLSSAAAEKAEAAQVIEGGVKILVAARGMTPAIQFALDEAKLRGASLFVLYIKQVAVTLDIGGRWQDDAYAVAFFNQVKGAADGIPIRTLYSQSSDPSETILDVASTLGVDYLVMGSTNRAAIINLIQGNVITQVARHLPASIKLIVVA
jgi:amino acid transporter